MYWTKLLNYAEVKMCPFGQWAYVRISHLNLYYTCPFTGKLSESYVPTRFQNHHTISPPYMEAFDYSVFRCTGGGCDTAAGGAAASTNTLSIANCSTSAAS